MRRTCIDGDGTKCGVASGVVFDIQRYSIEDGPGIRTVVFLKGCPLNCEWCANPEGRSGQPEVMYYQSKCRGCGRCVADCPNGAIIRDTEFGLLTDRKLCTVCGECIDTCYYSARQVVGKVMSIEEVIEAIERDRTFYETSGGGVTLSGGEALMQPAFTVELLKACQEREIHTAIETSGCAQWESLREAAEHLDLVFYDIKHIDSKMHKRGTGVDNQLILDNLIKLDAVFAPIVVRVPFIPGFNNSIETQRRIYQFVSGLKNVERIEVLPYHRLGLNKSWGLGKKYKLEYLEPVHENELAFLVGIGKECGVHVQIGAS